MTTEIRRQKTEKNRLFGGVAWLSVVGRLSSSKLRIFGNLRTNVELAFSLPYIHTMKIPLSHVFRPLLPVWVVLAWLLFSGHTQENILGNLDFTDGAEWALIGVPVTNYKMLPIQRELGTFITKDIEVMRKLQKEWNLQLTYDDKCDIHYLLKFYRNGKQETSLKVNLHCGYLDMDDQAYIFDPLDFNRFREGTEPIKWSKITFGNQELLQQAVRKMNNTQGVYWYENSIQSYMYPGYFMIQYQNLPWDANEDSLYTMAQVHLEMATGDTINYYLERHLKEVSDDLNTKRISYKVHCDEAFSAKATALPNRYMRWRSHFEGRDSISVIAIGVDKNRYEQIMRGK